MVLNPEEAEEFWKDPRSSAYHQRPWVREDDDAFRDYADIDAVEVLSEGVTRPVEQLGHDS